MRPAALRPLVLGRPAVSEQMLVSFSRHPFGAREVTIEGTAGALGIVIRVYVQRDPRHLAPVSTFRIGIQHTHTRDCVLLIVRREAALGGSWLGRQRLGPGQHGFLAVA